MIIQKSLTQSHIFYIYILYFFLCLRSLGDQFSSVYGYEWFVSANRVPVASQLRWCHHFCRYTLYQCHRLSATGKPRFLFHSPKICRNTWIGNSIFNLSFIFSDYGVIFVMSKPAFPQKVAGIGSCTPRSLLRDKNDIDCFQWL